MILFDQCQLYTARCQFRLDIPLLEYKSELLTWQDLALRIKIDCKKALITQVKCVEFIRVHNSFYTILMNIILNIASKFYQ